jgi:hypothetical protein
MFCSNCGTQVPDDSVRCTNCGAAMRGGATAVSHSGGGAVKGFFILVGSYFTMPIKTVVMTRNQLREIGSRGMFDVSMELPHLNWLRVAGGVIACVAIFGALLYGIVKAILQLQAMDYDAGGALMRFAGYLIIAGPLLAVFANWFIMYMVELISLWVAIANNIKKMADRR